MRHIMVETHVYEDFLKNSALIVLPKYHIPFAISEGSRVAVIGPAEDDVPIIGIIKSVDINFIVIRRF